MIKVGITGGIGSGKSIVAKILTVIGFPVFDSDTEAKLLMVNNRNVIQQVKEVFGEEAYIDKQLNRKYLADKIFNNEELKEQLNAIVHPAVRQEFEDWSNRQDSSLVFNEAAILFEIGRYKDFDYTILVTAPEELRIQRVIDRDKTTRKEVLKRMENQWKDEEKKALASFVINNDNEELVTLQIESILRSLGETI
ncbi:dephospho-CoA kinase [Brumimicrobium sp.]|uniref:dephospho-CoA kinase n=1 Tax=Brumimicrobium sp. TaxID=2029867 RepID=UPI002635F9C3|nr:dephospho-CoA kinase [uncultured Brumimicrobium sp.]